MDVKTNRFDHVRGLLTEAARLRDAGVVASPLGEASALAIASAPDVRDIDPLAPDHAPVEIKTGALAGQRVPNPGVVRRLLERAAWDAGVRGLPSGDAVDDNLAAVAEAEQRQVSGLTKNLDRAVAGILAQKEGLSQFVWSVREEFAANGVSAPALAAVEAAYADVEVRAPTSAPQILAALKQAGVPFTPSTTARGEARIRFLSEAQRWTDTGDSRGKLITAIEAINAERDLPFGGRIRVFDAAHGHLLDAGAPAQAMTLDVETDFHRGGFAAEDAQRAADGVFRRVAGTATQAAPPDLDILLPALVLVAPHLGPERLAEALGALLNGYVHRATLERAPPVDAADIARITTALGALLSPEQQGIAGKIVAARIVEALGRRSSPLHPWPTEPTLAFFQMPATVVQAIEPAVQQLLAAAHPKERAPAGGVGASLAAALDDHLRARGRSLLLELVTTRYRGSEQVAAGDLGWLGAYVERGAITAHELATIAGTARAAAEIDHDGQRKLAHGDLAERLSAVIPLADPVRIEKPMTRLAHIDLEEALAAVDVAGPHVDQAKAAFLGRLTSGAFGGLLTALDVRQAGEEMANALLRQASGVDKKQLPALVGMVHAAIMSQIERALGCPLGR